jgi:hypothetical protein
MGVMRWSLALGAFGLAQACSSPEPGKETGSGTSEPAISASSRASQPAASVSALGSSSGVSSSSSGVEPAVSSPATGPDASTEAPVMGDVPEVGGCSVFPSDNPWNQDISELPVHPNSAAFVASVGEDAHMHPDFGTEWEGAPIGIPYVIVQGDQARVPVEFEYADESDPGPYPVPPDAPIEGGPDADGDRHILIVDADACVLYELYAAYPEGDGASWTAGSGAIFDLSSNDLRPEGWTSADAAGLPILPGLVRYDEVAAGAIHHALRFTISNSQRAYVSPATHGASSNTDADLPPMGLRFRMKAEYDCSDYSSEIQVICMALKRYGMFVADNGSNWYLSGAPDPRWDDDALRDLKSIPGSAFEVVETGPITTY